MIISPAVAETELQHITIKTGNQIGGQLKTSALRLEPSNEAIQPAHRASCGNAGTRTQPVDFRTSGTQLVVH